MGNFIPVEPEKWAEMVKALAEVERLKAEVERLTFDPLTYLDDQGEWMPRHIHLAAVKRLKADLVKAAEGSRYWRIEAETDHARWLRTLEENEKLRAEVERLRKAGDAVSLCLEAFWKGKPYDTSTNIECFDAWRAAKEGKPIV